MNYSDTGNATITCSSACVPFLETPGDPPYRYIDVFSSSFQSPGRPLVRTNQNWILAFDYGVDLNRLFSEVISVEVIFFLVYCWFEGLGYLGIEGQWNDMGYG